MASCSEQLSDWAERLEFRDLPADVVEATKLRVLDVIGLALAGSTTPFGESLRRATVAMNPSGPSRLLGTGESVGITAAAFANGAMSQALEYDDTHNESIVHMSSPSVAAALALSESRPITGKQMITAIALGSEISCRVGSVAPGQFHRRGFHPTGLFATFGTTYLAGRLLGLDSTQTANAAGIAGSFASGILECWVDGTQSKFLHPGWAAQSGIVAAFMAAAGTTGPKTVFEGRFGLLASHLQDEAVPRDFARINNRLGEIWDSRKASFKPYPAAHVIHPYIDAILKLRARHAIDPNDVREIICPVASYIVPIVCQPLAEKCRPRSDSHGRVSFQYTLAEALFTGRLGKHAYQKATLENPAVLALAEKIVCQIDPTFPPPGQFKGVVKIFLNNGECHEAVEEHNRGSAENPMTREEIVAKFEENGADLLSSARLHRLADAVFSLESAPDASHLVRLSIRE
ncbi:MAG TPA: MmgE/PrpD family protein [Candidatus Binataceae bacterium]|nr:MmgE/PrpD family protein [Candidatus Binataceae bacterium]